MNLVHKWRKGQDILQWVKSGDARETINELVDMASWWRQFTSSQFTDLQALFPHPAVVDVANRTGLALARFGVVQLGGALLDPTQALLNFQAAPAFAGIVPTSPPDTGRFAVLLDALPTASSPYPVGRGVIAGAVACQVNVTSVLHGFAVPIAGNTSYLQSTESPSGAVILTQPTQTGLQWCEVALGRCCATNFASIPGGSSGGINPYPCSVCGTNTPTYLCASLGITGGTDCSDCGALASVTLVPQGACEWVAAVNAFCGVSGNIAYFLFTAGSTQTTLGVFFLFGGQTASYTGPAWNCTGTLTLALSSQTNAGVFCNFPTTITINPGTCGSGGAGGCYSGNCGSAGVPATLTGTVTSATGCDTTLPATLTFNCTNTSVNHFWQTGSVSFCSGLSNMTISCSSGTPILQFTSPATGRVVTVSPQTGWTASPFSAVYLVDDGAGNTCIITVT